MTTKTMGHTVVVYDCGVYGTIIDDLGTLTKKALIEAIESGCLDVIHRTDGKLELLTLTGSLHGFDGFFNTEEDEEGWWWNECYEREPEKLITSGGPFSNEVDARAAALSEMSRYPRPTVAESAKKKSDAA